MLKKKFPQKVTLKKKVSNTEKPLIIYSLAYYIFFQKDIILNWFYFKY